jgi:hypothetical protein
MRSGILSAALLFAALGLALASVPRRAWILCFGMTIAGIGASSLVPFSRNLLEGAFLASWISVITTAVTVYLRGGLPRSAALALSLNAGYWGSTVVVLSGSRTDLLSALPCVLILLPAAWSAGRYNSLPIKVVSSWLIVVAVLAATLQMLPVTPGYLPDHME